VPIARRPQAERSDHQAEIEGEQAIDDPARRRLILHAVLASPNCQGRGIGRIAQRGLANIEPGIDRAQNGQRRHERRQRRQHGRNVAVPRL
jgi:hypothetical protein